VINEVTANSTFAKGGVSSSEYSFEKKLELGFKK
jgi:hypothetical protein